MTDSPFDRFTRLLAGSRSRRQALAVLGALAAARLQPAHAAQLELAACGEAGAVCTPLLGCCSGLVCATSTVNPSYGVCITGEGEMLPVTDGLVVPGSEGITEELAGQSSDAAADASSAESILAAQEAEIQSRRTARRTARGTRQAAQQTQLRSNRTAQQTRKAANRLDRRNREDLKALNREPSLELNFILNEDGSELVLIENLDADAVVLERVRSLAKPQFYEDPGVTILEGKIYQLTSGTTSAGAWTENRICPKGISDTEGVELTVAQYGATKSHEIELYCGTEKKLTGSAAEVKIQSGKKQSKKRRTQKEARGGKGK